MEDLTVQDLETLLQNTSRILTEIAGVLKDFNTLVDTKGDIVIGERPSGPHPLMLTTQGDC